MGNYEDSSNTYCIYFLKLEIEVGEYNKTPSKTHFKGARSDYFYFLMVRYR